VKTQAATCRTTASGCSGNIAWLQSSMTCTVTRSDPKSRRKWPVVLTAAVAEHRNDRAQPVLPHRALVVPWHESIRHWCLTFGDDFATSKSSEA